MKLTLDYPCRPFNVTQAWGVRNTAYDHLGFTHHNGLDINVTFNNELGNYILKYPVYCPTEGFTVHKVQYVPQGGGHEVWLVSDEKLEIGDKVCHAYMVLCHGDKILAKVGDKPKIGELLMIADNTGFSTGTHTHWGLYRVDYNGVSIKYLDQNQANGSYDPVLFFTRRYAIDRATISTIIFNATRYMKWLVGA